MKKWLNKENVINAYNTVLFAEQKQKTPPISQSENSGSTCYHLYEVPKIKLQKQRLEH